MFAGVIGYRLLMIKGYSNRLYTSPIEISVANEGPNLTVIYQIFSALHYQLSGIHVCDLHVQYYLLYYQGLIYRLLKEKSACS
jgi:hypothetical protein